MHIAQVAPLIESVPPKFYGGTERVVSYLTEELVHQGHEVTLFASGDSSTAARLHPVGERALRLDPACENVLAYHMLLVEEVHKQAELFDVIHFHTDFLHYTAFRHDATPLLTTLHGRLDLPDIMALYWEFRELPVISISDNQRRPMPWLNWRQTIYHGLPIDSLHYNDQPDGYLAFIGRMCPEKRPDLAIQIARKSGIPLKMAAKVDEADQEYYTNVILPLLDDTDIDFIGEISEAEKSSFLGNALAVLFPIDWPEPFGLTMIEAMACGTPTIAFTAGSVPEVIDDGITGFIVNGIDGAVAAVKNIAALDRQAIRARFEERFTAERMARDYIAVYEKIQSSKPLAMQVA
jgi:glycosyltransferase involved in cell wall biosynthesis